MNEIKEIPVVRDEYGCWTHPEYEKFCDGREHISTEEFNAWMEENKLHVWVHHILQFLFSLKIYSTGVISASALWGLLLLYSTRYSASF